MAEFRILGELTVRAAGQPVAVGPARQRLVLAALIADTNQVVSVDQLIERVWGADPPLRARGVLGSYITRLRRALGSDWVVWRSGGYVLTADRLSVDLHRFRDLCERARHSRDDTEIAALLTEGLGLWHGPALTGLDSEWASAERDHLNLERSQAELNLTDARLRSGHGPDLVARLSTRTTEHPLDERVAGQYLLALYQAGRAADALRHYQEVRSSLAKELGVDPCQALQDLHQRILRADRTLTGPAKPPRTPSSLTPVPRRQSAREPSVDQLRMFLALTEDLDLGRAAIRTGTAQPAFSAQIRALEERLGVPLVIRSSRLIQLTDAGHALVAEANAVVSAVDRLRNVADSFATPIRGELSVGSLGAEAAMPYARAIFARMRESHPDLEIEVHALGFAEQFDALTTGKVDAAFLRQPLPAGVQYLPLNTESRVVCLADDDPLAGHRQLHLADIANRTVVDVPDSVPRAWWNQLTVNPRPNGTTVRFGPVVRDTEAMVLAVSQGRAITFLPASARDLYPRLGITYIDVPDLGISRSVLAWLPENRHRPEVAALREAARTSLVLS